MFGIEFNAQSSEAVHKQAKIFMRFSKQWA
jgi:hypothetical protein